jgi:hypothetical protein
VDWARDHPRAWLHALVVKAEAFWSWNLNPTTAGDTRLKELVYTASYAPTIVLALLAVIFLRAARRSLVFLALILAAFFVVHVLTVGYTRLRAPIDPLLIALASAAAVEVVATTQRFRATRIAGARSE